MPVADVPGHEGPLQAPNIDAGIDFGPSDVLFYSEYPTRRISQVKPGSTAADRAITLPTGVASAGGFQVVPRGYPGAGRAKIAAWGSGIWYSADLAPDGNGTFSADPVTGEQDRTLRLE